MNSKTQSSKLFKNRTNFDFSTFFFELWLSSGWKRHKKVTKAVKKLCRDKVWLFLSGFFNISKVRKIYSSLIFKPFFPSQQTNSFFSVSTRILDLLWAWLRFIRMLLVLIVGFYHFLSWNPCWTSGTFLILLFTVAAGTWIRFKVFPCLVSSHNMQLEYFGFSHDLKLIKNWPKDDYMRCSQLIACLNAQC